MEMANSIEGRTPFLDHHLAQFANFLPPSPKVHVDVKTGDLTEKWILREAGKPFISKEMYEKKKHVSKGTLELRSRSELTSSALDCASSIQLRWPDARSSLTPGNEQ